MTLYIVRVWDKLGEMIKFPLSWLGCLGLFVLDAVAGGQIIIYMVVVSSIVDLFCGIAVARRKKEFTLSELMRHTIEKLVVYALALLVFLCVDAAIEHETRFDMAITSGLVGVLITMTEVWSFMASLLILFPKNPVLKLLQKQLTGEIARKLGCEEKEVAKILKAAQNKPKRDKTGRFVKQNQV